jgi:hypothetical protein
LVGEAAGAEGAAAGVVVAGAVEAAGALSEEEEAEPPSLPGVLVPPSLFFPPFEEE